MGSRLKEDEKHEKIVRGLAKREENRRCINCRALGPQYVCTNFSIFVCTNCSGVHREFTHRVKSISMAKFTASEVAALQGGGNERGRESFLKSWDSQRHPLPDSSHPEKLREFIKAVYVDRRYAGDMQPPRGKQGEREDISGSRKSDSRSDTYSESQSPGYEDRFENRRYSNRPLSRGSDGGRYEDRSSEDRGIRYNDTRSPGRFVPGRASYDRNDRDRQFEDRFANEGLKSPGRFDNDRSRPNRSPYADGDRRFEDRLANERREPRDPRQPNNRPPIYRDYSSESSPPVRSVREILGDDIPALQVQENFRPNGRVEDASRLNSHAQHRKELHTSSFGSSDNGGSIAGSDTSLKHADSRSLIDFNADLDGPAVAAQSDPFGVTSLQVPTQSDNTGWASFDTNTNMQNAQTVVGVGASVSSNDPFRTLSGGVQELTTLAPAMIDNQPSALQWSSGNKGLGTYISGESPLVPRQAGSQVAGTADTPAPTQAAVQIPQYQELQSRPVSHNSRKEIPQDLFTPSFAQTSFPSVGMQSGQYLPLGNPNLIPFGSASLGGGAQGYNQRPKSKNPFDFSEETDPVSTGVFPNMAMLQAALPTVAMGSFSNYGFGAANPQWSQPVAVNQPPTPFVRHVLPGVGGYYNQQPSNFIPPVSQQYSFPPAPSLNQSAGYQPQHFMPTSGSAPPQSSTRPVGGNPFD